MENFGLYLVVALGTFMSYLFSPTLDQGEAKVVFKRLFYGQEKQRRLEWLFLWLVVFGGAAVAFFLVGPQDERMAVTSGLGWTSIASAARAAPHLKSDQPTKPPEKNTGAQGEG